MTRLRNVDYLIPNETEAEALTGMPIREVRDARACAARMLTLGPKHVVLTLGANGPLYASNDHVSHLRAFEVSAIDTSGAGDAFIGSFAYFLASGLKEREAIARSNLYAALSTLHSGTRSAFPTREEWSAELLARRV